MNAGFIDILNVIWGVLTGTIGGINFIQQFSALGLLIFGFLVFKSLATESVNLVTGKGTELPKTLIKYLFVTSMIAGWPWLADSIYTGVLLLVEGFFPDFGEMLNTMLGSWDSIQRAEEARKMDSSVWEKIVNYAGAALAPFNLLLDGLLIAIAWLILILCYALIMINAVGAISILLMNLVLGPVFFALAFDKDFRSPAVQWMTTILSYTMLIPLYGATIRIAAAIAGAASFISFDHYMLTDRVSSGAVAARCFGPILAVGIVFSTNRVISSLIGGTGGSGLGGIAAGVAAAVAKGAVAVKTGGASAAISGAASGASRGAGQAVRAATGRR